VELAEDAVFAGWDILCLGRPAAGERFDHGEVAQRFELWRNQQPLLIERLQFAGGDSVLDEPWGLGGASVTGTFLATSVPPGGAAILQNQWPESAAGDLVSATQFEDVVACRYLGGSAERARKYFTSAWSVLRPLATSRQAVSPRVWAT
jgi:urease accessory protein